MAATLDHVDLDNLFADDAIGTVRVSGRLRESTRPLERAASLWVITRHADVVSIVRDHESSSSAVIKSMRGRHIHRSTTRA